MRGGSPPRFSGPRARPHALAPPLSPADPAGGDTIAAAAEAVAHPCDVASCRLHCLDRLGRLAPWIVSLCEAGFCGSANHRFPYPRYRVAATLVASRPTPFACDLFALGFARIGFSSRDGRGDLLVRRGPTADARGAADAFSVQRARRPCSLCSSVMKPSRPTHAEMVRPGQDLHAVRRRGGRLEFGAEVILSFPTLAGLRGEGRRGEGGVNAPRRGEGGG